MSKTIIKNSHCYQILIANVVVVPVVTTLFLSIEKHCIKEYMNAQYQQQRIKITTKYITKVHST